MERPKQTRLLKCSLTSEEFTARSEQLAKQVDLLDELADRKAAATSKFKTELEALNAEQRRLATIVEEHAEPRITECRWVGDYSAKIWRMYRDDTGEIVETETMTAADLQPSLLS